MKIWGKLTALLFAIIFIAFAYVFWFGLIGLTIILLIFLSFLWLYDKIKEEDEEM